MRCNDYLKQVVICLSVLLTVPCISPAADQHRVEYETGYYYTIQKGDTLWNLSDRFLDSPQKWPNLWKENGQIQNPHWIHPGERIRLYHTAGVKELEKEPAPVPVEKTGRAEMQEPMTTAVQTPYFHYSPMDQLGFVRKNRVEPSGLIFKVNDDKVLIGDNDIVYIKKMEKQPFVPGTRYTVYRIHPTGKDNRTIDYPGVQHYFSGIVDIIRDEPKYAVAVVVDTYRAIQIGDLLMPFEQRSPNVAVQQNNKAVSGQIICSEQRLLIFGGQSIAFIDKGTRDGIVPGQTYSIYRKERARLNLRDREDTPLIPLEFASLLVLLTEESTATVIITAAERDVSPGARFHVAGP